MASILVRIVAVAVVLGSAGCAGEAVEPAPVPAKASVPAGWSALPDPPFVRVRGATAWTGSKLVYWGGETGHGSEVRDDGAALDLAAGTWQPLALGPLWARAGAVAVWTGDEVLVWGGEPEGGPEGAAYDPSRDDWRALPDSPLGGRVPVGAVWTGTEMIVWGSASRDAAAVDGAAYDPRADSWRELPPAPFALNQATVAWTGRELVVFGARLDGNNWSDTDHARGAAFDPTTSTWRAFPPYPFSPQASTAVWTGRELVVWDYELRAAAYSPEADDWRPLPDLPLDFSECYPQGAAVDGLVLAWHCGRAALLDTGTWTWREVHGAPGDAFGPPVAAGSAFLLLGVDDSGEASAWAFRPD
jgi:hypothetical protein